MHVKCAPVLQHVDMDDRQEGWSCLIITASISADGNSDRRAMWSVNTTPARFLPAAALVSAVAV